MGFPPRSRLLVVVCRVRVFPAGDSPLATRVPRPHQAVTSSVGTKLRPPSVRPRAPWVDHLRPQEAPVVSLDLRLVLEPGFGEYRVEEQMLVAWERVVKAVQLPRQGFEFVVCGRFQR